MILNNPIIFLLVGEEGIKSSGTIKKYFSESEGVAYVYVCGENQQIPRGELEMGVCLNSSGKISFDIKEKEKLDSIVRLLKYYRYSNRENVNICIITDCGDSKYLLKSFYMDFCESLHHAFLNHVLCDMYYIVKEQFILTSPMTEFINRIEEFQKEDWLRFIFIISDVSNEGVLKNSREELFENILDSIMLEIGKEMVLHDPGRSIYDQLSENVFEVKSKLLTIGRMPLDQSVELKKKAIAHELCQTIWDFREKKPCVKIPISGEIDTSELGEKIYDAMQPIREGLHLIAYYNDKPLKSLKGKSNKEVLYSFFRSNNEKFIEHNKKTYNLIAQNLKTTYYQIYLESRIDNLLQHFSSNTINLNILDYMADSIMDEIDNKVKDYSRQFVQVKSDYDKWINDTCDCLFGLKNRILSKSCWTLLDRWGEYQLELIFCDIMQECLYSIRHEIETWRQKKYLECQKIIGFRDNIQQQWDTISKDSKSAEWCLLDVYAKNVSEYLSEHDNISKKYLHQLYANMLLGKENPKDVEHLTEHYVSSLYTGKLTNIWFSASHESNAYVKNDNFYKDLYNEIIHDKIIQIRGWLANIDPYICLIGSPSNMLMQSAQTQEDNPVTIYLTEKYIQPVVIYYQHIGKTDNLYLYKKIEVYEESI